MFEPFEITLFNTMSRTKEKLVPLKEGHISFYSCGQTVYEDVHVGNAKTYTGWDLLVRVLKHFGYSVKHVQNFTDVGHLTDDSDGGEDKIQKRANLLQEHPMELVDRQITEYNDSMDQININRPDLAPRATGHIAEMIQLVKRLEDIGIAYNIDDSLYFDTSKVSDYGKLARLNLENQQVGVREEVKIIEAKRNPSDFALWIKAPPKHIMQYISPWGMGYPGWHLECSVMAMKYLGETIDIHAGGIDHIPIHHTNEIAQSESVTGKPFANIWLHSEFITLNGEKMSKSTGNFVTLRQLIDEVGPAAARYSLTQVHYRTQGDFSMEKADASKVRYDRLIRTYHFSLQQLLPKDLDLRLNSIQSEFMDRFNKALADDLNAPLAFTVINDVASSMEQAMKEDDDEELIQLVLNFQIMMHVMGVPIEELSKEEIILISTMVEHRLSLREEKKFQQADTIRDFLNFNGYTINDVANDKTEWFKPNRI